MKKIGKILYKIISFFDKYLITPITKLILKITLVLKDNGKGFERLLNKKQTLIVLSLLFSFIIFFVVYRIEKKTNTKWFKLNIKNNYQNKPKKKN